MELLHQLSGASILQTSDGETSQPDLALEDTGCMYGEGDGIPFQYSCLENPWTEEPGRLQSTGLQSRTLQSDVTVFLFLPF